MILGTAATLPVVAAVATEDKWEHLLHCPYCDRVHMHGGHGPDSPFGAINGGRVSHCVPGGGADFDHANGMQKIFDAEVIADWYVLFEVPGVATIGVDATGDRLVKTVSYAHARIAGMRKQIGAFIAFYETMWEGPWKPRGGHWHPAEVAFRSGKTRWLMDWQPPVPITETRCALYLHYDADGVLLYVGISEGPGARGKAHAKGSTWAQFATRGEMVWCVNRDEALIREARMIRDLQPIFNDVHAAPGQHERLVAYLAAKGRYDLLVPAISRG